MPLRVLVHSWRDLDHPEAGGAERYIVRVAEGLVGRGHHVTIRTARYPGSLARETRHGVRYVRAGGRLSIYPRALAHQMARSDQADVVIDVQNGVPYLSPLARHGPVVNLVHHVHREQWPYLFGRRMAAAGWWAESRLAPRVYRTRPYVAVSDATRRDLVEQGVDATRIRVIHNGTDARPESTSDRSPSPTLVVVGRLVPQKRIELAIDVTAELLSRWPSLRLDVVGSGWWGEQLEAYTAMRGLSDVVTFHGHVSEQQKHELFARAWVHVLPSVKEGWGLVVLEAGVHGTPTVAFRAAGGPADSIVHQRTGLLVDDAAHFLSAVATLLDDGPKREQLGSNARNWAARFRWEQTVEQWEKVLTEAVADDGLSQDPS